MSASARRPVTGLAVATSGSGIALGIRPVATRPDRRRVRARSGRDRARRDHSRGRLPPGPAQASAFEHALRRPKHGPCARPSSPGPNARSRSAGGRGRPALPASPDAARGRRGPPRHPAQRRHRSRPDQARRLLGDDAWELLRPDRPEPSDAQAPGTRSRGSAVSSTHWSASDAAGRARKLAGRILDEVERAVVGKRDALELILLGLLGDGHILIEDYPGPREDADRPLVRAGASLDFRRIQFTPDLMPSDITGTRSWTSAGRVHVPAGADLHQPASRRRDQPRPAEDAGGAARGDAGAAGHARGRDVPARRAVPGARDAEPDRVRGHLPAAGGAARPVPDAHRRRLPEPRRRDRDARRAGSSAARTRSR